MAREGLFEDLPEQASSTEHGLAGRPRMREPVRDQIELRAVDLDSVIGADHPARVFWAYVQRLDLRELEDAIKAREDLRPLGVDRSCGRNEVLPLNGVEDITRTNPQRRELCV